MACICRKGWLSYKRKGIGYSIPCICERGENIVNNLEREVDLGFRRKIFNHLRNRRIK